MKGDRISRFVGTISYIDLLMLKNLPIYKLEAVATEIKILNRQVVAVAADTSDRPAIEALIKQGWERFGKSSDFL